MICVYNILIRKSRILVEVVVISNTSPHDPSPYPTMLLANAIKAT